jgi:Leucine-rich repeat (LRR) protein
LSNSRCGFEIVTSIFANAKDLRSIPAEISLLSGLQVATFSRNGIDSLPTSITELSRLSLLDLDGNRVERTLDWSSKNLTEFPGIFLRLMSQLESLDLSQNQISTVKNVSLLNAQTLNLSSNAFQDFPFSATENSNNLRIVDLSDNNISFISEELFNSSILLNLDELYIRNNVISSISYKWGIWSNTETKRGIHVRGNPIEELLWGYPDGETSEKLNLLPIFFDEIAPNITKAVFRNQKLGRGKLPEELGIMENLEVLDLSYLHFGFFSLSICNLTKLRVLDITANDAGHFSNYSDPYQAPQCFSNWPNLEVFNVSQAARGIFLTQAGYVRMFDAPNIKVFNASHTIEYIDHPWLIPLIFSKWTHLETLDLDRTGWRWFNQSFAFPSAWNLNSHCYPDDPCVGLSTSWGSGSSTLRSIYLSDMWQCDSYQPNCDIKTNQIDLTNLDYQWILNRSNIIAAGFNCAIQNNTKFSCFL